MSGNRNPTRGRAVSSHGNLGGLGGQLLAPRLVVTASSRSFLAFANVCSPMRCGRPTPKVARCFFATRNSFEITQRDNINLTRKRLGKWWVERDPEAGEEEAEATLRSENPRELQNGIAEVTIGPCLSSTTSAPSWRVVLTAVSTISSALAKRVACRLETFGQARDQAL
jgi:hypothetical protein